MKVFDQKKKINNVFSDGEDKTQDTDEDLPDVSLIGRKGKFKNFHPVCDLRRIYVYTIPVLNIFNGFHIWPYPKTDFLFFRKNYPEGH